METHTEFMRGRVLSAVFSSLAGAGLLWAQPVAVRHPEGLVHGFLALRTLQGETLADGDLLQNAHGPEVTSRLVFHFKDGSLYDETTVFSQKGRFRLLRSHLVQKGPAFKKPMEADVASDGRVAVRWTDDDGQEKTQSDRLKLPTDLANGLLPILLKNVSEGTPKLTLSLLVFTPRPRLVKLAVAPDGEETFRTGATPRKAVRYVVKTDIGGVTGALADALGKTPPDAHVWILPGETPAFVRSELPFYAGAPLWRVELGAPAWP
jgi:hypothetical protein